MRTQGSGSPMVWPSASLGAAALHPGAQTWGPAQARHLLMRAGFGASPEEIASIAQIPREQVVALLLADLPLPAPPGDWVDEPHLRQNLTREQRQQLQRLNRQRIGELLRWWFGLMMQGPYVLREKMVLFWHGHFVIEASTVKLAQYLYRYSMMLRRNALGNFRTFLKEMWKDPAMLIYLNGKDNVAQRPNENFARELLELFTMGVDSGYTETDIKEAARAFSGWRLNNETLQAEFIPRRHDDGTKTFLGRSGRFGGDEIIDIVLEQPAVADFICTKIYKFFCSPKIDREFVSHLATIFRNNNYEIAPVLRAIFSDDSFYAPQIVGSIIKSPLHLVFSLPRQFPAIDFDVEYLYRAAELLDQTMLNPPNVAGWEGQRAWISPLTLATRGLFGEAALTGGRIDRTNFNPRRQKPILIDIMAFARSFQLDTPRELLTAWLEHLLPFPTDEATFSFLLDILLEGAAEQDWSLAYQGVEERITRCLVQILRLPEYQLT